MISSNSALFPIVIFTILKHCFINKGEVLLSLTLFVGKNSCTLKKFNKERCFVRKMEKKDHEGQVAVIVTR